MATVCKSLSDDEEVKLNSHRKGAEELDPPGVDIRDILEASDTQRDEWLLKTEPLRQTSRGGLVDALSAHYGSRTIVGSSRKRLGRRGMIPPYLPQLWKHWPLRRSAIWDRRCICGLFAIAL